MQTARVLQLQCSVSLALNYCRRAASKHCVNAQRCLGTPSHNGFASIRQRSTASTEVLSPPHIDSQLKEYSPKIEHLVDDISQLTLLEVADLNELLKKTLNIQDAPMMAMGAMPMDAPKSEEDAAPKREKTNFSVKLTKFDTGKKVQLIKEIKAIVEGLNLVQAKKFVESLPQVVKADIPKDEAEKLKEQLIAVGADVEID